MSVLESLLTFNNTTKQVVLNKSGRRAIRLDAWALDERNRQINTEMQNTTTGADVRRRARFYQRMLDTPILKSGKKTRYKQLPQTVVIFITQEDIFGKDLILYTFTEQCEEVAGLHPEDGTTRLLNMKSKNGRPELYSLLQYMKHTTIANPEIVVQDPRITELDDIVNEVKQSEEWEAVKMNILETGIEKGREEGRILGKETLLLILSEYGTVPDTLKEVILKETDITGLDAWIKKALQLRSIEAFSRELM